MDLPTTPGDRWSDILRYDAMVHLPLMASVVAATFQGWLKDRIGGPLPYAISDLCFIVAAAAWFGGMAIRHQPIRGPGAVPAILLAVILVPTLYLLHPGAPLVVELAGLRAWAEFPVAALIALTTIRTRGQVRAYVWLILGLCAVTAMYGILQYRGGADAALSVSDLALQRHGSTVLYAVQGTGTVDFRAFSTFTFPAPFAGMMVFGILLAAGIVLSSTRPTKLRVLAAILIPLLFVGMTVSGTRAALVILLLGLVLLGWYRRLGVRQLVLVPLLLAAFHVGALLTAGRAVDRFATLLLAESQLWGYLVSPIVVAAEALRESWFGMGLGRTGVGVPFAIVQSFPSGYFIFSDGDIGRAAAELGVVGLGLLAAIVFGIVPNVHRAARGLADTPSADLALGIGPLLVATGVLILIGSPFSSAPHGIMWWFLAGAVFRLEMVSGERRGAGEAGESQPCPVP